MEHIGDNIPTYNTNFLNLVTVLVTKKLEKCIQFKPLFVHQMFYRFEEILRKVSVKRKVGN